LVGRRGKGRMIMIRNKLKGFEVRVKKQIGHPEAGHWLSRRKSRI